MNKDQCFEGENKEYIIHLIILMPHTDHSQSVTLLTLAAAAVGAASPLLHPAISILLIPILLLPKYMSITDHPWTLVGKLTLTTFCFGLIDGIAMIDIISYITSGYEDPVPLFQIYLCLLTVYHYFQFQLVNNFHHHSLSWQSFLLYHSRPYMYATAFMLAEHFVTKYVFGFAYKVKHPLIIVGLVLVIVGESLRVAAFFTCRHNFTHLVRYRKVAGHQLVTNGIYSIFRHPSYTGYFYFSVGGQILLGNILSSILFAIVLIKFFNDRIQDQEITLSNFFPQYITYRQKTWIFIPFVKGPPESKLRIGYYYEE